MSEQTRLTTTRAGLARGLHDLTCEKPRCDGSCGTMVACEAQVRALVASGAVEESGHDETPPHPGGRGGGRGAALRAKWVST